MLTLTKSELNKLQKDRMNELFQFAGDKFHLAAMMNKKFSTIESWVRAGAVSKAHALEIENHPLLGKHFEADYLRPDLYVKPMTPKILEYKRLKEEKQLQHLEDELDEIDNAILTIEQDFSGLNLEHYDELPGAVKRESENSKLKRLYEELRKMKEEHIRSMKEKMINEA